MTGPASSPPSPGFRVARVAAAAGAALVLATSLATGSLGALGFAVWALAPYALLLVIGGVIKDPWVAGGAGAAALTTELGIRASVFLFPTGSTSAIALVFSPILIIVAALPAGAVGGWLLGKVWRRTRTIGRALAALVAATALGLLLLGLARPDLFPTAVWRRQAQLERLGEPRVIIGADAFETVVVSDRSAWNLAGELDGTPGDEIAVVDHDGVDLLDPVDFRQVARVDFTADRLWTSHSTLARIDGRMVVVHAGGGYSATEVRGLDGRLLWSFRPDPDLPPSALRPADLDGDGENELYAAHSEAIVRLDAAGRVVWNRPSAMASLVALVPASAERPAWVVAAEHGRKITVWDAHGEVVGELPHPGAPHPGAAVLGAVSWPADRALVLAGTTARGIDLAGETRFEVPLGELTLRQALTVRFQATAEPHLVLLAAAPRDVDRWRLLVLSPDGRTVYDELLGQWIQLFKARRADGGETLLMRPRGLRCLRPAD